MPITLRALGRFGFCRPGQCRRDLHHADAVV